MKDKALRQINIEDFYIRYGPMVLRRCRSMLGNEQAAYDAMQDVFLKMLKKKNQLTGTYPSTLLYRIATNTCLNRIRDERNHEFKKYLHIVHNLDSLGNEENRILAKILVEYALEKEKGFMRAIAVMYFINGMTIKEIAAVMKLSISGVHKNLKKLQGKIRQRGEVS